MNVTLVDKGRGVGGRVATRWKGTREQIEGRWDHGAQFASFRSPALIEQLKAWKSWDVLDPWLPGYSDPACYRNRPLSGMNTFAKSLAEGLTIHRGERIHLLEKPGSQWLAHSDSGKVFQADQVMCTLPMPQFLDLAKKSKLHLSDEESTHLHSVKYDRCLTLLVDLDGPSGLEENGYVRLKTGILDTLIDQYRKGISSSHTLVAHATPAFSLEWYDRDRTIAASVIRAAVQEQISSTITEVHVHGWKFAKATQRIPKNFLRLENGLILAGDGFAAGDDFVPSELHPRIESAMLSGWSAGNHL